MGGERPGVRSTTNRSSQSIGVDRTRMRTGIRRVGKSLGNAETEDIMKRGDALAVIVNGRPFVYDL